MITQQEFFIYCKDRMEALYALKQVAKRKSTPKKSTSKESNKGTVVLTPELQQLLSSAGVKL